MSSDQGAVGDLVAVDLSLTITKSHPGLYGLSIIGCHDEAVADLIEQPLYASYFAKRSSDYHFFPLGGAVGPQKAGGGQGFALSTDLGRKVGENLPIGQSIPIMTLFFKLKGKPGHPTP
jgi:hypothetical protein